MLRDLLCQFAVSILSRTIRIEHVVCHLIVSHVLRSSQFGVASRIVAKKESQNTQYWIRRFVAKSYVRDRAQMELSAAQKTGIPLARQQQKPHAKT